eukprot:TRINITY_DN1427_c0_g1_i1.p1 TRINITY_DN1427_c0_g1~~TRINITY_DN1427_c0_g1_i1.p1  ORF type:complete len:353 (-),score=94.53 TRINITY_DN1427_c0_g1_i1:3-1061(-)
MLNVFSMPSYEVPRDSNDPRFVQSFTVDQVHQYKQFFEEFGFIVIRDVLNNEQNEKTIREIWNFIENNSSYKRTNVLSWNTKFPGIASAGILSINPIFLQAALENRQNENIYQVFSCLMERQDLLVNHDRYGFFRPTKNVQIDNSNNIVPQTDFPQWKTKTNLHLDMNPWRYFKFDSQREDEEILSNLDYSKTKDFISENNYIGVENDCSYLPLQGLINLIDNFEDDGGFYIVPGFRKHLKSWSDSNLQLFARHKFTSTFVTIPDTDPIYNLAIRVTARAGSLIIWDQRTAHGSKFNCSSNCRFAQFLRYFPVIPTDSKRAKCRSDRIKLEVQQQNVSISELGYKLFGIQPY